MVVVLLATIATFSHAGPPPRQIHSLRPHIAAGGHNISGVNCLSWRLGVESNNIRDWGVRGANDTGTAVEYKSKKRTELVKKGYRIIGNIGDQWSDLLGDNAGARTFKLPDPMYYIA
nr:acid phosphatase 1-like [Ipomoea batatas]